MESVNSRSELTIRYNGSNNRAIQVIHRAIENKKKIERAVINTLQLATRKNLI
jgi:hypothetical protein